MIDSLLDPDEVEYYSSKQHQDYLKTIEDLSNALRNVEFPDFVNYIDEYIADDSENIGKLVRVLAEDRNTSSAEDSRDIATSTFLRAWLNTRIKEYIDWVQGMGEFYNLCKKLNVEVPEER